MHDWCCLLATLWLTHTSGGGNYLQRVKLFCLNKDFNCSEITRFPNRVKCRFGTRVSKSEVLSVCVNVMPQIEVIISIYVQAH